MKKILSFLSGFIAIIIIIILIIMFIGVTEVEKARAKDHPLSDVLSGEDIEAIYFQNGRLDNDGCSKLFKVTDTDLIDNFKGVIETATITEELDESSVLMSHYLEKYMTLEYKNGTKVKVTFYGTGDSLLGFGRRYYKVAYTPPANEFLTYTKANLFSYDKIDDKGNVIEHIENTDPYDIDLKEVNKWYRYYWKN